MPLKTDGIEEPGLNLTPMIDIVFLLIIFFMVGTQFSEMERQFDVNLPTVADAQPLTNPPDEIVVSVFRDGRIFVQDKEQTLEGLQRQLEEARARYADQSVLIRGEGEGRYQRIIDVLVACHRAKIKHFSLATELKSEG